LSSVLLLSMRVISIVVIGGSGRVIRFDVGCLRIMGDWYGVCVCWVVVFCLG